MKATATLLVAGGTTESREAAETLAELGYAVLLTQATNTPFALRGHPGLRLAVGRLAADGWTTLVRQSAASAVVDAGHPYAVELHATLREVTSRLGVPLLRLGRPESELGGDVLVAREHDEAARFACRRGERVFVTTGSSHLARYVSAAAAAKAELHARVLDCAESRAMVSQLGLEIGRVFWGRGPFSVAQNLEHLRASRATVLVTKDSGREGGYPEKLEAARRLGCRIVVVARPEAPLGGVSSVEALVQRLRGIGL